MKQLLKDFGLEFDHISIKFDNISDINLSKNLIKHSHTKHIELMHIKLEYKGQSSARSPIHFGVWVRFDIHILTPTCGETIFVT